MSGRGVIGRNLTFLGMILVFVCVAAYGAVVAAAALDMRRLYEAFPDEAAGGVEPGAFHAAMVAQTEAWVSLPGAQDPAHDLRVEAAGLALDEAGLARLRGSLEAQLEIEPAASLSWVRLARVRALSERPMVEVEQALRMSVLTGRYEMTSMVQRLLLAMPLWSDLSDDMRRTIRSEIRAMAASLNGGENQRIKGVAQTLPQSTREEIYSLFHESGRQF